LGGQKHLFLCILHAYNGARCNSAPMGVLWPPGVKMGPRGEDGSPGWTLSRSGSYSFVFLNSRQGSALGFNEGWAFPQGDPWGPSSPFGSNFTHRGELVLLKTD
jgi:hypothetical protein